MPGDQLADSRHQLGGNLHDRLGPIFESGFIPRYRLGLGLLFIVGQDTTDPILIDVYVDGQFGATVKADRLRSDVAAAYPQAGAGHGFAASIATTPGEHNVCAYAINTGPGVHVKLSCSNLVPGWKIGLCESFVVAVRSS